MGRDWRGGIEMEELSNMLGHVAIWLAGIGFILLIGFIFFATSSLIVDGIARFIRS